MASPSTVHSVPSAQKQEHSPLTFGFSSLNHAPQPLLSAALLSQTERAEGVREGHRAKDKARNRQREKERHIESKRERETGYVCACVCLMRLLLCIKGRKGQLLPGTATSFARVEM
jgi:hypothetical protein